MSLTAAFALVLVAAATPWLEVLVVVPAAVLAGLPVVPTIVVATIGNVLTLIPVVVGGDRLREWLRRRRATSPSSEPPGTPPTEDQRISRRRAWSRRMFDRYGLPGLALVGPLLTGIHVAAIIAVGAGAPRRPALVWLSTGVAVWAVGAAVATVLGVETLIDPASLPDLFGTRSA